MNRRTWFKKLLGGAAIVALAPQLCFKKPRHVWNIDWEPLHKIEMRYLACSPRYGIYDFLMSRVQKERFDKAVQEGMHQHEGYTRSHDDPDGIGIFHFTDKQFEDLAEGEYCVIGPGTDKCLYLMDVCTQDPGTLKKLFKT